MFQGKLKNSDYERASQLLGKLFEVDSDITEQINKCIQYYGIIEFFKSLDIFDFSQDVYDKLEAVRNVLFGLGENEVMPQGLHWILPRRIYLKAVKYEII